MKQNIQQLQRLVLVAFGLVCLGLIYWQILRASPLLARDDNPRLVIAEQRIKRGKINTNDKIALAESVTQANGTVQRHYPYPNLAAVTGYYSLRYGTGGLEAAFDKTLRGENQQTWLEKILHHPPVGQAITVTIQLPAQIAADIALSHNPNTTGAVIVMDSQSGALLVMASRPTFDPNKLDENWDELVKDPTAPLINRATQGLFPLGEIAYLIAQISYLEADPTLDATLLHSSLTTLRPLLRQSTLTETMTHLQFNQELDFHTPTAKGVFPPNLVEKLEEVAITPLHLAQLGAALMQAGETPKPTLIQPATLQTVSTSRLLIKADAARLTSRTNDFIALASSKVTGNEPLSWYLGLIDQTRPLVIVVVVTTPEGNSQAAEQIAQATLKAVKLPQAIINNE